MRDLLQLTAGLAGDYLDDLALRPVAPPAEALAAVEVLAGPLSEQPQDVRQVVRALAERIGPATTATAGPRYFGFVTGGVLPAALAANWLAAAWDQPASFAQAAPAVARLETIALHWLLDLLGLPADCAGGFTTGATMANFTALAAARNRLLLDAGWDVEARGLFGAPQVQVLVSAEVHPAVRKALGLLGFGRDRVIELAVDDQGRIRADRLPEVAGPAIVCTQVGNVNTGACDPVGEICRRMRRRDAWVHVDGAFGLWAAASPALRGLAEGVADADSWATDGHKWLNLPYDSGVALVREPAALRRAMAVSAQYLPATGQGRDPCDYTPELSRRARGIEFWAALASLGRQGVAELVERNCRQARRFADGLTGAGHQVLNRVWLNQVLVRFGDDATTERIIAAVQADGTCWCGRTLWQERVAMRISVSNWSTRDADIDRSLAAILRLADAGCGGVHSHSSS